MNRAYGGRKMKKPKIFIVLCMLAFVIFLLVYPGRVVPEAFFDDYYCREMIIRQIAQHMKLKNAKMPQDQLELTANTLYEASREHDVDYRLVLAIMEAESNYDHDAVSSMGARGIMQIRPILAEFLSKDVGITFSDEEDLHEPDYNIKLGVYYLARLDRDFSDLKQVIHAYNVGHNRAREERSKKTSPNTRYVKEVIKQYQNNLSRFPEI
jgi:soluble lytic murein transglycosylase